MGKRERGREGRKRKAGLQNVIFMGTFQPRLTALHPTAPPHLCPCPHLRNIPQLEALLLPQHARHLLLPQRRDVQQHVEGIGQAHALKHLGGVGSARGKGPDGRRRGRGSGRRGLKGLHDYMMKRQAVGKVTMVSTPT